MPKLTTAQIEDNAFKTSLGEPEKGLMACDYNTTANTLTVNSISIAANPGKTFIVVNGILRSM